MKWDFETLRRTVRPVKIIGKSYFRVPRSFTIDSRTLLRGQGFIAVKGTLCDGHDFIVPACAKGAKVVIAEKVPVPLKGRVCVFLVKDSYRALQDICRVLVRNSPAYTIAVTGSVGKTTTKEMIAFLLSGKGKVLKNTGTENNLLGVCKTVLRLDNTHDFLITELGTNAPGEIASLAGIVRPRTGVITCVKPVHLQGLRSMQSVFEEKKALLEAAPRMNAVLNDDDPRLRRIPRDSRTLRFGRKPSADIYARRISWSPCESGFMVNGRFPLVLKTAASFFIDNALAAIGAASIAGVAIGDSCRALGAFTGYPAMRMQRVKKRNTVFINDAYNSNPFSLKSALDTVGIFPGKKIAVIGDMRELGKKSAYFHRRAAADCLAHDFEYIVTCGEESRVLHRALKGRGFRNAVHYDDTADIAAFLRDKTGKKKYLVFLKGSRALALEAIIEKF